jgi:hypothetical protein
MLYKRRGKRVRWDEEGKERVLWERGRGNPNKTLEEGAWIGKLRACQKDVIAGLPSYAIDSCA